MNLFASLSERSPNKVFLSVVLGALSGVAYAFLIPLVLNSLETVPAGIEELHGATESIAGFEVTNVRFAAVFLFTCLFILVARSTSQILLLHVSMEMTASLRLRIYHRISQAPIAALERMGTARLHAVLTNDVGRIIMGARVLPDLIVSAITLLGMLGFLLYMNTAIFFYVMGAIVVGVVTYQIPMFFGNRALTRSRVVMDDLQSGIHGLIAGAKELKLNADKRSRFFEDMLLAHEKHIMRLDKHAYTIVRAAMNYGDLISFFVIGTVTFIFVNYHAISSMELVGIIMALLYVTGPVTAILNFVPRIVIAKISLRKLQAVLAELPAEELSAAHAPPLWGSIRFDQVGYRHEGHGDSTGFQVGPVSFTIARGDVTFVVGGNGSGKSTLSKLITLHYLPAMGEIAFGNVAVTPATISACREEIGAVFTDYHLFEKLWSKCDASIQQQALDYLRALGLDHKVSIKDGRFSTLNLSDGQRKRLALLVAILEDRNLYLFDEWAADQDPIFKEFFYYRVLPDLKRRNKAVVVISHDDRYFDVADRILVMADGRLVHDGPALPASIPAAARLPAEALPSY